METIKPPTQIEQEMLEIALFHQIDDVANEYVFANNMTQIILSLDMEKIGKWRAYDTIRKYIYFDDDLLEVIKRALRWELHLLIIKLDEYAKSIKENK